MVNIREVNQLAPMPSGTENEQAIVRQSAMPIQGITTGNPVQRTTAGALINMAVADAKLYADREAAGLKAWVDSENARQDPLISRSYCQASWDSVLKTITFTRNDGSVDSTLSMHTEFDAIFSRLLRGANPFAIERVQGDCTDYADFTLYFNDGTSLTQTLNLADGMLPAGTLGLAYDPSTTVLTLTNRAGQTATVDFGLNPHLIDRVEYDEYNHILSLVTVDGTVLAQSLPVASDAVDGLMPKESVSAIDDLQERVNSLEGKGNIYFYAGAFTGDETVAQLNDVLAGLRPGAPADQDQLRDSDGNTWTYFLNQMQWFFTTGTATPVATNSSLGIVEGYESGDGKVYVEANGKMSVIGWDSHAQAITTNTANIATNTTKIATNATNIATNTANIATNATNIAANTTKIATNATNIAANTTAINGKAPANVALTGTANTDATIATPAVASATVASVLQTIWNKIRSLANYAAASTTPGAAVNLGTWLPNTAYDLYRESFAGTLTVAAGVSHSLTLKSNPAVIVVSAKGYWGNGYNFLVLGYNTDPAAANYAAVLRGGGANSGNIIFESKGSSARTNASYALVVEYLVAK
jgi:hypothetical protein